MRTSGYVRVHAAVDWGKYLSGAGDAARGIPSHRIRKTVYADLVKMNFRIYVDSICHNSE
jgi:hypothetical protein